MVRKHQTWIKFIIKIIVIFIMGYLWSIESVGIGTNSVDKNSAATSDYYWVGGSGNWSDLSHWATSSGGSINHTYLPSQTSNVYFDINSFSANGQEVVLDVQNAICADMDWTGALNKPTLRPDLSITPVWFKIYGSLTFIENMLIEDSNLKFSMLAFSGEHTVTTDGHMFDFLCFDDLGGTWLLEDDLEVNYLGTFKGKVDTRGHKIRAATIYNNGSELILNNSTIEFTEAFYAYDGSIVAGTSTIIGRKSESIQSLTFQTSGGIPFSFYNLEFEMPANVDAMFTDVHNVLFHKRGSIARFNHIGKITFLDNGVISQEIAGSVDTLFFSPGKSYEIQGVLKIDSLRAIGTCDSVITIKSSTIGIPASLEKQSGTVKIEYVNLSDIKATGGAQFKGKQVSTSGDVSGWTLQIPDSRRLYWVGGTGNWYDSKHWSLTSGGPSGECTPASIDDVIFDSKSFPTTGQKVTADGEIFCRDMSWLSVVNSPSFQINSNVTMNIFGSLKLTRNMQFNNQGSEVNFLANKSSQTISSGNHELGNKLKFYGNGAEWRLVDSLSVGTSICVQMGRLVTNNQNISTKIFSVLDPAQLIMGSSTFKIKSRFVACGYYDSGTSSLILGNGDYDSRTGTLYSGQDLFNVKFTGENGRWYTDGQFPYDENGNNECFIGLNDNLKVNNLSFLRNAEIQATGKPITVKSLSIGEKSKVSGDFLVESLTLNMGSVNEFTDASFKVLQMKAQGTCDSYIQINGGHFETSNSITIQYCILNNVSGSNANLLKANNSIGLGSNPGWTINELNIPNMYWVGGTGLWSDQGHWSTESGGIGGACIPNITSNIHFDANSFTRIDQKVTVDLDKIYFKSMDWTGVKFNPTLRGDTTTMMSCFGSIVLSENMTYEYKGKSIEFLATTSGQTIDLAGHSLHSDVLIIGSGEWRLVNDFNTTGKIWMHDGVFDSDGYRLSAQMIISSDTGLPSTYNDWPPSKNILRLHNSEVRISDEEKYSFFGFNEFVEAGTSTIILPGGDGTVRNSIATKSSLYNVIIKSGTEVNDPVLNIFDEDISKSFHNITIEGTGSILMANNKPSAEMTINKLTFLGSGYMIGSPYTIDSVILSSGNTYRFSTFNIESYIEIKRYFDIQGVSCQPITIKSYFNDQITNIIKSSGIVSGSYLNLQGIHVSGGAQFYAGEGSVDLGNNSGWIFDNAPEPEVGFLGPDTLLFVGQPLFLDATHYGSNISYLWNTGQTTPQIEIQSCGDYFVQVSYGQDCAIFRDTIQIAASGSPIFDLILKEVGNASCKKMGYVILDSSSRAGILSLYSIQLVNDSTNQVFTLQESETRFMDLEQGNYSLQVTDIGGCFSVSKKIEIAWETVSLPFDFLGQVTNATCSQKGKIQINRSAISDIPTPYRTFLIDLDSGLQYLLEEDSSIFVNVKEGSYSIRVEVSEGCPIDFSETIQIKLIKESLPSGVIIDVVDATCSLKGEVTIDRSGLSAIKDPYIASLVDLVSELKITLNEGNSVFTNVPIGNYRFQVEVVQGCPIISPDVIKIQLLNDLLPSGVVVDVIDATCGQKGEIAIDKSILSNIAAPFEVYLVDLASNHCYTLATGISTFTKLTEGTYNLSVVDSISCTYNYSEDIVINLNESNCRTNVISPGFGETLTVPFHGLVYIYDHSGKLIRRFNAPGEWDGSDQSGQIVPIGNYILIADENRNQIIEVTIIR